VVLVPMVVVLHGPGPMRVGMVGEEVVVAVIKEGVGFGERWGRELVEG
jgi:hypothetical protein